MSSAGIKWRKYSFGYSRVLTAGYGDFRAIVRYTGGWELTITRENGPAPAEFVETFDSTDAAKERGEVLLLLES